MRFLVVSCAFLFSTVVASFASAETPASRPVRAADSAERAAAHRRGAAPSTRGHHSKSKRSAKHPENAPASAAKTTAAPAPFQPPAASLSRPIEETPAPAAAPSPAKKSLPRLPPAQGKRARKAKAVRAPHGSAKSV